MPAHVRAELAASGVAPQREPVTFEEYLALEEYHRPRPAAEGLDSKTIQNYTRAVRRIGREIHADENRLLDEPPRWEAILTWRDDPLKGGRARLETDRKALVHLAHYWGQGGGNMPHFLRNAWDTAKAVERAVKAGTMRRRIRFLHYPDAIEACLAASPFEDAARGTRQWANRKVRKAARYMDATWKTMLFLGTYAGARPSEYASLMLDNYQPDRGGIFGWQQPKKHSATRDVIIPETFVWRSRVDPSLDHYLRHVRPVVDEGKGGRYLFLNSMGRPFLPETVRNFISDGMRRVLGNASPGPHGLRRLCATARYAHGWTIDEVAILLDDSPRVVEKSYLDWSWIRTQEIPRTRKPRPPMPMLRSRGNPKAANKNETRGADEPARGNRSAPVGI